MIRCLNGQVVFVTPPLIVLNVGGVGYELFSPTLTPAVGDQLTAIVFTVVRAESITLYGFQNEQERGLFGLLIGVSGIGPKSALLIMSALSASAITTALQTADPSPFLGVKGVGKKVAERLVLELAGSINRAAASDEALSVSSALANLGYSQREYKSLLSELPEGSVEEQITWALRRLSN